MRLGGSTHLVQAGAGPASSIKEEEGVRKKKRSPSPKSESSSYELPSAHHVLCVSPLLPLPHAANLQCDSQP